MRRSFGVVAVVLAGCLAGVFAQADDSATVTDVEGKEHKITGVKFNSGTRRLSWLADPKGTTPDAKLGPTAIEIREHQSTTYADGVVTLVPCGCLESAKYDYEKQVATLAIKGIKEPLAGTLQYKGINVLGFGGTIDGKTTSFTGGVLSKTAVKTATFAGAEPVPKPKDGLNWAIQIIQPTADNPTLIVRNLKVLYRYRDGTEQLVEGVPVRKGQPLPFNDALKRFEMLANDTNLSRQMATAEIEVGTGPEKLIAIPLTLEQDKKTGTLVGFLGEVDAGYKLFPLHTIKVIKPHQKKVD